jgi:hypothetical protein
MSDLGTEIYNETANLGKIYATIQIIIGIIIFIICFLCGMYNVFSPSSTANTTATITNVNSSLESTIKSSVGTEQLNYSCNLEITYVVNNITYRNNITLENSEKYVVNQTVDISYRIDNPNDIGKTQVDTKYVGSISMVMGSLLLSSLAELKYGCRITEKKLLYFEA